MAQQAPHQASMGPSYLIGDGNLAASCGRRRLMVVVASMGPSLIGDGNAWGGPVARSES